MSKSKVLSGPHQLPEAVKSAPQVTLTKGQSDGKTSLREFVKDCDVMICPYLAEKEVKIDAQKLFIDLCAEAGVNRWIASEYTLEYPSLEPRMFVKKTPILRIKKYLDTKDIKSVHILVGMFTETLFSNLFYFWDGKTSTSRYYGTGNEILELTTYFTTVLKDRRSTHQIISDFKEGYATEPIVERLGSLEDFYKQANITGQQDYILTDANLIQTGKMYLKQPLDAERYQV